MEIFKPIIGFEKYYQVSNKGNIKSIQRVITRKNGIKQTVQERLLKQSINSNGYPYCVLFINGKGYHVRVHRCVAEAFLKNIENKPCVNHVDGDKKNNCVENLEWVSHLENNTHALTHGLRQSTKGEIHGKAKLKESDIKNIIALKGVLSSRKVAEKYNLSSHTTILRIWRKQNWKHVLS